MSVELFHWDPRRYSLPGRFGRRIRFGPHTNNFGDLLGPMVVRELARRAEVDLADGSGQLLSVGSVLHFARDGAVIWGAGFNGKQVQLAPSVRNLDIRAVRGPLTADALERRGFDVPAVFGDPALLVSQLWPAQARDDGHALTIVPNLHDLDAYRDHPDVLDPRSPVTACLSRIAASRLVVGSSLHGIVVAESFGVAARLITSSTEPEFKYRDYYRGTGRRSYRIAADLAEATRLGGEDPLEWDPAPLLAAFPADLWKPGKHARVDADGG